MKATWYATTRRRRDVFFISVCHSHRVYPVGRCAAVSRGYDVMTSCLAAAAAAAAAVAIATTLQLAWRSLHCRDADACFSFTLQALPFCAIIPAFHSSLQSTTISAVSVDSHGFRMFFLCPASSEQRVSCNRCPCLDGGRQTQQRNQCDC